MRYSIKKIFEEQLSGVFGWLFIIFVVVSYDAYAIKTKRAETLSSAFWRWSSHPIGAFMTTAVWAALTHHLLVDNRLRSIKEQFNGIER